MHFLLVSLMSLGVWKQKSHAEAGLESTQQHISCSIIKGVTFIVCKSEN